MKKYFSIGVLIALAALTLGSCVKNIEEEVAVEEQSTIRTVSFSAALADQTKTGLSIKFVPNWIKTKTSNVHLFETNGNTILEGVDLEMRVPSDRNNEVAYFKADFSEEISIIVNPPSTTSALTRAASDYVYTGIVAQAKTVGNTKKYFIPAEQLPDAVSLIDPDADFLIGNAVDTYSSSQALKEMDMFFKRPVAVSRLAIMNVEGTKITSVKITSLDKLTGETTYDAINFPNGTATFDNSGSNTITMTYEGGAEIEDGSTFYAYFISLTGTKRISEVEVTTDQYVYTKSYAGGKSMKFDNVQFKNIAVDMSKVTGVPVGPVTPSQTLSFRKNGQTITSDIYDLHSSAPYSTPTISGLVNGSTVDWSSSDNTVATVSGGVVTPIATGQTTITAVASATGYQDTEISYTLTVSDTTPLSQTLEFTPSSVTVVLGDSYTTPTLSGAKTTVTYASDNTAVATVDQTTGALSIVGAGTATITATAAAGTGTDGKSYASASAEYTVEVSEPAPVAQTLSFNPTTLTVVQGDNTFTTPTLSGDYHTEVTYTSSDPTVVAVDAQTGALSILTAGEATITATAPAGTVDGVNYSAASASYDVTVVPPLAPVEETTYNFVSGALSEGTYLIIGDDLNADPTTAVALFPNTVTKNWGGSSPATNGICVTQKEITLVGTNPITTTDPEIVGAEVELIASGNGWKVKAKGGKYLVSPTSTSDANHVYFSENAADGSVFTAGNVTSSSNSANGRSFTVSGSSLYLFHSGSASGFTIRGGTTVSNLRFYKKAKKTQSISFDGTSAEYDLKDVGSWVIPAPNLDRSGAETTVTFASSNTAVAEVNTTSGTVTIPSTAKKGDSAVITATAEETDEYEEATASYTITIVDTTPGVMVTYKKVTSQSELVADGTYLIVYENGADSKVFKPIRNGSSFTTSTANAEAVTITNNTITSSELDDHTVVFRNADGNTKFAMWVPGTECYMILRRNYTSFVADAEDNGYRTTFTVTNGSVTMARDNYYFRYSTSNNYFQVSNTSSNSTVALYKQDDGTTPTPAVQTITFTPTSAQYDLFTKVWTPAMPVLGGAQTTVTYLSSDATIASVANDGTITPLAAGEVTITANAEATAAYQAATTTCTVTITDSTPQDPSTAYYQRVTASSEFVQDGTYIIVNESNNKVFKPVLNSSSTNFQTSNNTIDVTITDGKIASSSAVDACQIVLKNADGNGKFALFVPSVNYYLQVYNGSNFKADATDNGYRSTFSVTSAGVASIYRDNTHYIRYSGSSSAFQVGNNSNNIAVYKYVSDGGSTPDDPEPPTPSTSTYTRISGASELVTGTYIIVERTDTYVFNASGNNHGGYGTIGTTSGISQSGTTITLSDAIASSYEFTFTRTGDNLTIQPVAGEFAGKYMYATNNVGSTYIDFQTEANNFTINAQAGDYVYFRTTKGTSSNEYLYKKSSDSFFKLGGSGAPSTSNADAGIYLYKKN